MSIPKRELVAKVSELCLAIGSKRMTVSTRFGEFLVDLRDAGVGRALLVEGEYGYVEMMKWFQFLTIQHGRGILLDIGANIGTTCIPLACGDYFREIHAFEPEPENFSMLSYNVNMNNHADTIHVHNLALGDHTGTVTMELSHDNCGDHRVRYGEPRAGLYQEDQRRTLTTPCTTLDLMLRELSLVADDISLIKADVEGSEGRILLGASELLATRKVPWVIEFWPYALDRSLVPRADFIQIIQTHFSSFVEMAETCTAFPISGFPEIFDRTALRAHCDLVLLP